MARLSEVSVGSVIGRLTIRKLKRVPYKRGNGKISNRPVAVCDCSCGTVDKEILVESLGKLVQACGCLGAERRIASVTKHGMTGSKAYVAWSALKQRIMYDKGAYYYLYGGRGLKVSKNFLGVKGFENFLAEVGEPPTQEHSLDRKDSEIGYFEGNLRWATAKEQARNKRSTLWVNYKGRKVSFAEAVELTEMPYQKVYDRFKILGWSLEKSFETSDVTIFKEENEHCKIDMGNAGC